MLKIEKNSRDWNPGLFTYVVVVISKFAFFVKNNYGDSSNFFFNNQSFLYRAFRLVANFNLVVHLGILTHAIFQPRSQPK